MNKKRFRTLFNRVRGLVMVVPERAAHRSSVISVGTSSTSRGHPPSLCPLALRPLHVFVLLAAGYLFPAHPVLADGIVADNAAPTNQQPVILETANGIPQVNIQTPSAAGVSRNTYSQFDVGVPGAILNNSRSDVQTQLGGYVQANPYLAAASARVILNEVNSSNPSLLNGYVEVAGSRAQVVIANPAGISCNGCGFINANRATLTTGTAIFNNGNLEGYRVQRGTINIFGNGMDSRQTDYTDILARAVQVNANLFANDLRMTTGSHQVNVASDGSVISTTPISSTGTAPSVAIDVAQLGGMYAGKIYLIGTEAGVGVTNAGHIGASAGEVRVDVNGILTNAATAHINSRQDMQINANSGITNAGTLYALGSTTLNTQGDLDNTGTIAALGNVSLTADGAGSSIRSSSESILAAGLNADGTLSGTGNLTMGASSALVAQGQNLAIGNMAFTSSSLDISHSQTYAHHVSLTASAGHINVSAASLTAKAILSINANSLTGDGNILSEGDIDIQLASDYTSTGQLQANGDLSFSTSGNFSNRSDLLAGNALILIANNIDNTAGHEISGADTTIRADNTLTNRGNINGGHTFITANALNNIGTGSIFGDHVALQATTLTNDVETVNSITTAAVIASRINLDIGTTTLNNLEHALTYSGENMAIGGSLDANHEAISSATTINNISATINAMGALTLTADQVNNINAHFSTQVVDISSRFYQLWQSASPINDPAWLHSMGTLWTASQVTILPRATHEVDLLSSADGTTDHFIRYDINETISETQVLSSDPGQILSGGNMLISVNSVLNDKSQIISGGSLTGNIGTLNNTTVAGQHIITNNGYARNYYRIPQDGGDSQGLTTTGYNPTNGAVH